jgi:WD40 repeat protein
VVSESEDGTARQWDVEFEMEETILASTEIGYKEVQAVFYSPDTTLIATGGFDEASIAGALVNKQTNFHRISSIKIRDVRDSEPTLGGLCKEITVPFLIKFSCP